MIAGLRRTCALLLVIVPGLAPSLLAQAPLESYRIDLARHFFASLDAQRVAVGRIDAALARMESLRGRVGQSASSLERALTLSDSLRAELLLHFAYFTVRTLTDTMLRSGYSDRAPDLLQAHLGIRVDGAALAASAVRMLEADVAALEARGLREWMLSRWESCARAQTAERCRRCKSGR